MDYWIGLDGIGSGIARQGGGSSSSTLVVVGDDDSSTGCTATEVK